MSAGAVVAQPTPTPVTSVVGPAVGVIFPGDPRAASAWSGTPSGVIAGLRAIGARPRPLSAAPPQRVHALLRNAVALAEVPRSRRGDLRSTLRMGRAVARNSPAMGRVYTRVAREAAAAETEAVAMIQIGTGYRLAPSHRVATYEDMTIRQALDCGYPEWRALGARRLAQRLDAQRRAYEAATVCCFTTWWAARSAIEDYGIPEDKVRVVGVGRNHCVQAPTDRDWSVPRFLFIGWEWERKNGPAVLRAFARLRESVPGATLDIVGQHPPIDAPGVTDHGVLRLDRPHERAALEPLLGRATCFVMPSRTEPSALAYVEAMSAGLPTIGTVVGGAGNLIGDGGCVVDPSSDAALVAAMSRFSDPECAARVGAAAQRRSQQFTWPAVAARLLRALDVAAPGRHGLDAFVDRCVSPELTA